MLQCSFSSLALTKVEGFSAGSALLDDVSVDGAADVPRPASLALLGMDMLAAGATRRRKQ